jgi:hypothetical protein
VYWCPAVIQSNIFCLSAADNCGLGDGGIVVGASTALALIRSQLPTMVQSTVKFNPPVGAVPVWQPLNAQLFCNMVFTPEKRLPAGACVIDAVPVLIQPSTSLAAIL